MQQLADLLADGYSETSQLLVQDVVAHAVPLLVPECAMRLITPVSELLA
jgi:hypothetical protein